MSDCHSRNVRVHRGLSASPIAALVVSALCLALSSGAVAQEERTQSEERPKGGVVIHGAKEPYKNLYTEPPDGEWLVDEQDREYFIRKVPKIGPEGRAYRWLDDEHAKVRLYGGLIYDVVDEDEEYFYAKRYRSVRLADQRPAGPTPEEIQAVVDSYQADLEWVDRLSLEPVGLGLPHSGQWRNGFDIADFDGDGNLDIIHGPPRKGGKLVPHIFLGDGHGGFRLADARFPPLAYDYGDAAVADFNQDGKMDLALAIHLRGVLVLVSNAAEGGFELFSEGIEFDDPTRGGPGTSFSSRALEAVDWNMDGLADLLVMAEGPKTSGPAQGKQHHGHSSGARVYLNNGDGTWSLETGRSPVFGDGLALGDFNGDGRLDFVVESSVTGFKGLLHLGSEGTSWEATNIEALRPGIVVRAVAAADIDGDGRDDLAVGYSAAELGVWRSGVDLFFATEDGEWLRQTLTASEGSEGILAADFGDLDGDGSFDLVTLSGDGETWIFLGDGEGSFVRESEAVLAAREVGCAGLHVRLVDMDGDGLDEIVAAFAGEQVGLPGVVTKPGCEGEGSLRVWKPGPKSAPEPADES